MAWLVPLVLAAALIRGLAITIRLDPASLDPLATWKLWSAE